MLRLPRNFISLPNVCLFLFKTIIFLLATVSSLEGEQLLKNLQKEALFIPLSSLSDYVPIGKGECLSNGHWSQCAMARASEGGWYHWGGGGGCVDYRVLHWWCGLMMGVCFVHGRCYST